MMKKALAIATAALCVCVFSGCGSKTYKDGTYTARSAEYISDDGTEDGNGYGELR